MGHEEEETAACRYISHRRISDSQSAIVAPIGYTAVAPES
jgi:hypothetical protein